MVHASTEPHVIPSSHVVSTSGDAVQRVADAPDAPRTSPVQLARRRRRARRCPTIAAVRCDRVRGGGEEAGVIECFREHVCSGPVRWWWSAVCVGIEIDDTHVNGDTRRRLARRSSPCGPCPSQTSTKKATAGAATIERANKPDQKEQLGPWLVVVALREQLANYTDSRHRSAALVARVVDALQLRQRALEDGVGVGHFVVGGMRRAAA